jgi:hypothetical protein
MSENPQEQEDARLEALFDSFEPSERELGALRERLSSSRARPARDLATEWVELVWDAPLRNVPLFAAAAVLVLAIGAGPGGFAQSLMYLPEIPLLPDTPRRLTMAMSAEPERVRTKLPRCGARTVLSHQDAHVTRGPIVRSRAHCAPFTRDRITPRRYARARDVRG